MLNAYEDPHAAQWGLPEIKDLPEVQNAAPFELETLPVQIRGAARDVSDRQQSPIDFVAVSALCALSGVIGRRAQIHPKQKDDWLVTPNLWGALIGGPSSMKSPAMAEMTKPLERLEASYSDSHRAALIDYDADKKAAALRADTAEKEAKKLMQQGNDAEAKRVLMAASDGELVPPQKRRFTIGDVTPEKLGEMLSHNPNGLLVIRDELAGLIARCSTDAGAPERAFLLQCYNGNGRYSVDRIGRGETLIPACCIGMLGGIQPSKLAPLVRGAVNGSDNDGFIQRFQLAVWPDIKEGFTYVDRAPSYAAMQTYGDLFTELDGALPTLTPDEGEPLLMRFEPTLAQPVFAEWLTKLQAEMRGKDCDLPEALQAHLLKMPKVVSGLALIFELVKGSTSSVSKESLVQALTWFEYLRSHAERIYGNSQSFGVAGAHLILERKTKLEGVFTARDVRQKGWRGLSDSDAVTNSLSILTECGYLTANTLSSGGRPTTVYQWRA